MHGTVKNLATFCIIMAAIHAFMGIALIIYASGYKLSFATEFCLGCYIITSIVSFLVLGGSLRGLCGNLELEQEINIKEQNALKKRIEALEFKVGR